MSSPLVGVCFYIFHLKSITDRYSSRLGYKQICRLPVSSPLRLLFHPKLREPNSVLTLHVSFYECYFHTHNKYRTQRSWNKKSASNCIVYYCIGYPITIPQCKVQWWRLLSTVLRTCKTHYFAEESKCLGFALLASVYVTTKVKTPFRLKMSIRLSDTTVEQLRPSLY